MGARKINFRGVVKWGALLLVLLVVGLFVEEFYEMGRIRPYKITYGAIMRITDACEMYRRDNGRYPSPEELTSVVKGFKNSKGVFVDGWGTPLRITFDDDSGVLVTSAGADKVFGTNDDKTN